jgi:hypothetical protein
MAVRYGSPLKRAVTFHIPLALLVGATLFPFYWMDHPSGPTESCITSR